MQTESKSSPEPSSQEPPKLYQFVGLVFVWLVPCFIVWISLSSLLAAPAVWVSNVIMTMTLPSFVHEFTLTGPQAMLATHFGEVDGKIVSAQLAGYRLAYPLDTRVLSYSLPFYAALHFATPANGKDSGFNPRKFGVGMLVLYPLFIMGLIIVSIKNLMLGLGPVFIENGSLWASLIGLSYQLSTLMVPALAPVLVWAWQSKENPLLTQLLIAEK